MRTIQQIIAEITRDVPSARVMGGKRAYAYKLYAVAAKLFIRFSMAIP